MRSALRNGSGLRRRPGSPWRRRDERDRRVLAADWGAAAREGARSRAALRRRFEALGTASCGAALSGAPGAPLDREPGLLARRVRDALPRLHDRALRRDLEEVLGALER